MADLQTWDRCWSEAPGGVPDYFAPGELLSFWRLRTEIFHKYLVGVGQVSEFGAGLGHNLLPLKDEGVRLRAFDWSQAAVRRCRDMGLEAQVFDMLEPDLFVNLNGAVLTVHAMEQLGDKWGPFLQFLLTQPGKPLCIHIEPISELYDESARDQERLAYHRKRGYMSGYLPELERLDSLGRIKILEVRKSPFGGKDHDAYSVIVWRTL